MAVKLSMLLHVNYGTVYLSPYDKRHQYKSFKKSLRQLFLGNQQRFGNAPVKEIAKTEKKTPLSPLIAYVLKSMYKP